MNRIVIVGRLGADPELRQGRSGTTWCQLSVATNRPRKEAEGWVEETDWHDVRVFGDDAERCHKVLCKGSIVAIDGQLNYDAWTDDQGQRRRKPRIVASRVQFVADTRQDRAAASTATDPTVDAPLG